MPLGLLCALGAASPSTVYRLLSTAFGLLGTLGPSSPTTSYQLPTTAFGLLWALGAAVAWGSADFCAKKVSTTFGFWPAVWSMNAVGALILAGVWAGGGVPLEGSQLPPLLWLAVGNAIGGVVFYFALEHGPLSLVSPITAAYPVVSAAWAYLLSGERLAPAVAAAVGAVILGTLLAGWAERRDTSYPRAAAALVAAAASALIFGTVFYGLAARSGLSSPTAPVLVFRVVGAALLAAPFLWGRRLPPHLFRSPFVWATGILDSLAYLLYAEGARRLAVSVVSALSGLFTVWTLLLAALFLRERLNRRQWVGVGLLIAGIAALGLR